jgi:hypothetical protein
MDQEIEAPLDDLEALVEDADDEALLARSSSGGSIVGSVASSIVT